MEVINNRDNFDITDKFFLTHYFKISPKHNPDGWGNKLVTIFARTPDDAEHVRTSA